ncbi:response regulator transcription factor [Flavobacteriaceae bacterium F89]|uniref:Response regulator transcription factor n=1 Tax=Cerina litoralis TaxID=2874477 RepID=A0AAE3ERF2_9FLAO|nr:response regulator transcription factor [Cerina litoralis]MCG2459548.1 response regulator transcription factor [Cerina litoralis]
MADKNKILLVEDDTSLGYLLSEYLKMKGFDVHWAKNGLEGLEILNAQTVDLAILDVMMPDMDGFTLAGKIQSQYPQIPFIFLTARSLKIDVLKGFSLGAVDYLKKPIDEEELVVRIRSLLSRLSGGPGKEDQDKIIYKVGAYTLFTDKQELHFRDEIIRLTGRENELLAYLIAHENELCSHKDILIQLWGKNDYFNQKSLNVFVSHLRKYLGRDPSLSIENIHRKGFILKTE